MATPVSMILLQSFCVFHFSIPEYLIKLENRRGLDTPVNSVLWEGPAVFSVILSNYTMKAGIFNIRENIFAVFILIRGTGGLSEWGDR
jgi:hypothetical protein